jgi:hypothetical protein
MIEESKKKQPPEEILSKYKDLRLPLIRLKVDYTGNSQGDYQIPNAQRFGQQ